MRLERRKKEDLTQLMNYCVLYSFLKDISHCTCSERFFNPFQCKIKRKAFNIEDKNVFKEGVKEYQNSY